MQPGKQDADNRGRFDRDITPSQRQKARTFAMIVGLVPVVFFGLFSLFGCFMMESWIPLVFFGGFGLVIGGGLGGVTYMGALKKASNLDRPWEDVLVAPYREFAEEVGGTLVAQKPMLGGWVPGMPEYVSFLVDGNKAVLRHEQEPSGQKNSHLRLAIDLPEPTDLRCHVYDQDVVSKITGTDINLGWERFDKHFAITAPNRSDLLPRCLTRQVQDSLLQLKQWLRKREHPDYVELFIERDHVAVRVNVLFDNKEDLAAFYQLAQNLYARLRETLP